VQKKVLKTLEKKYFISGTNYIFLTPVIVQKSL